MSILDYDKDKELLSKYNYDLNIKRIIQELQGISSAIIYDGKVEDYEISLMEKWIIANSDYLVKFPLTDLNCLMKKILLDGIVTKEEREELLNFLSSIANSPEKDPVIEGIFTPDPIIMFAGKQFLFTGELSFGTRKRAMNTVESLGGICSKSSSFTLKDDYLVIGCLGSNDYKYGRFGSKIEKAIELVRGGKSNAQIVREKTFVEAVINKSK